jgi:hypothetical protein
MKKKKKLLDRYKKYMMPVPSEAAKKRSDDYSSKELEQRKKLIAMTRYVKLAPSEALKERSDDFSKVLARVRESGFTKAELKLANKMLKPMRKGLHINPTARVRKICNHLIKSRNWYKPKNPPILKRSWIVQKANLTYKKNVQKRPYEFTNFSITIYPHSGENPNNKIAGTKCLFDVDRYSLIRYGSIIERVLYCMFIEADRWFQVMGRYANTIVETVVDPIHLIHPIIILISPNFDGDEESRGRKAKEALLISRSTPTLLALEENGLLYGDAIPKIFDVKALLCEQPTCKAEELTFKNMFSSDKPQFYFYQMLIKTPDLGDISVVFSRCILCLQSRRLTITKLAENITDDGAGGASEKSIPIEKEKTKSENPVMRSTKL